jgi:DNA processing protein
MESTTDDAELRELCTLARAPCIPRQVLQPALLAAGGLGGLLRWSPRQLLAAGFGDRAALALAHPPRERVAADARACRASALQVIGPCSPRFPELLAAIPDPPNVLFVRGDAAALHAGQVAVVGSRRPTALGERTARELAYGLALRGVVVTSGFALGIDAAGHAGALAAGGRTVAVCGAGLDVHYPREHGALGRRIAERGALVSEFPPGTPPLRNHFVRRNRLISGLSRGVVVVEAARRSGSLSTARLAGEQGREVFAVPGSIHSALSAGCHQLIRHGAALVESVDDVLAELDLIQFNQTVGAPTRPAAAAAPPPGRLDNPSEILLDALGFVPTSVDALIASTGFSGDVLSALLLELELQGRVAAAPGGRYRRILEQGPREAVPESR